MSGDDDYLSAFLKGFGFDEEELIAVSDELDSFRTIPRTIIERYMKNPKIRRGPTNPPSVGFLLPELKPHRQQSRCYC
jgi:hypothetical protein